MHTLSDFDVIAFDADDTLWRSEDDFVDAEDRFVELLVPHVPDGVDIRAALRATERTDLSVTGYGVKAFTLSMVSCAVTVTDGEVPGVVVAELVDIGRSMLTAPVRLLDHVPEVLQWFSERTRVVMVTKGDLVHQTRKVTTSGIAHHFARTEIVLEKDEGTYRRIVEDLGVAPERFCMIGNSVRSDVLPVLGIGGLAVHVPYHITWENEIVDDHDAVFPVLDSIADLPALFSA